jgi:hypothetical protein
MRAQITSNMRFHAGSRYDEVLSVRLNEMTKKSCTPT